MLCYYNVHVSKDRGKFSRFPEHHWVASSMIYASYATTFFNRVYLQHTRYGLEALIFSKKCLNLV